MNTSTELPQRAIVHQILALVNKKVPQHAHLLTAFAEQYYSHVPSEYFQTHTIPTLAAGLLSHWELCYQRLTGECKIHIHNPVFSTEGWDSKHTVVEIVYDDSPFLIDSARMAINRQGYNIHSIIHLGNFRCWRNDQGELLEVLPATAPVDSGFVEALIYLEIDRQSAPEALKQMQLELHKVFAEVRVVVEDWPKMQLKVEECLLELEQNSPSCDPKDVSESKEFLRWLALDHFTFLGCVDYRLGEEQKSFRRVRKSGLGIFRDETKGKAEKSLLALPPEARKLAFSPQVLVIAKTNTKANIHRPVYTDYIGVKRFNSQGELIGERRFIGLYTSTVYYCDPRTIPLIRRKVELVLQHSNLPLRGHAGKALLDILISLPRDDLFQASTAQLSELALGILPIQEKKVIRLFIRPDAYRRFISCLVYLPKEQFNTELQLAMQACLMQAFSGQGVEFAIRFEETNLARIHFLIRTDSKQEQHYNIKDIEAKLIELARSWKDNLFAALIDHYGEEQGIVLFHKYARAFPSGYRDVFPARIAVSDIAYLEKISPTHPLEINLYRPTSEHDTPLRLTLFQAEKSIALSDVLPMLENMGLRVMGEWPAEINLRDGKRIWINDFAIQSIQPQAFEIDQVRTIFQEAFACIWRGEAENDGFNRLIFAAQLNWREVSVLRAYTKYLKQIQVPFSQTYIETALTSHAKIAGLLITLFKLYFDPAQPPVTANLIAELEKALQVTLDAVASLDEDRILRYFLALIRATVRTNYFQKTVLGKPKAWLSFKFDPSRIADLALPRPLYEIFVYSPQVEGLHLRAAKVARGGIRWSDRREDFRTEILGLMKAQQVKNAIIVPGGAKGGFVCKALPVNGVRETVMRAVIECYQTFIRGLLDLTDNLQGNQLVPPVNVRRYDADDPYLVVAADKGTASFSDIANAIAVEYHFWLGDAFASGGSVGYDHKKMGITARGAWESVKRHCQALGLDPDKDSITVIGIGDMSGDVFGNGLLLSRHIQLKAAINHLHIFLDPTPDPQVSFQERKRLFELSRSSWEDYNPHLISQGGGVFRRYQKTIPLSPEAQAMLGINQAVITPDNLIQAILTAEVDLLWNGGIGTYVKASYERHADVGDRMNDSVRVNAQQLRCRIVAEGGNLGFTQLARIEYALKGGLIYTDFIDNSAGVDCSDHEVNCKILLNSVVNSGDITIAQRNQLLMEMTDAIIKLVLHDNYAQTRIISLATVHAFEEIELYRCYIQELEQTGKLNRSLEFLPDDKALLERKAQGKGLTSPEIAVLLTYTKILLKAELLAVEVADDIYLTRVLESAFPEPIRQRFAQYMPQHSLRREIIATKISNTLINDMGITFVYRLKAETGADIVAIVRAYTIARQILDFRELLNLVEFCAADISLTRRYYIIGQLNRLVRREARWLIYNYREQLSDIDGIVSHFKPQIAHLHEALPRLLVSEKAEQWVQTVQDLCAIGVSETTATRIASVECEYALLDIVEISLKYTLPLEVTAKIYFKIGAYFEFDWLREQLVNQPLMTHWDTLARVGLLDDLDIQQRRLTVLVLRYPLAAEDDYDNRLAQWITQHPEFVKRWQHFLTELRATHELKFLMFTVVMRMLIGMVDSLA